MTHSTEYSGDYAIHYPLASIAAIGPDAAFVSGLSMDRNGRPVDGNQGRHRANQNQNQNQDQNQVRGHANGNQVQDLQVREERNICVRTLGHLVQIAVIRMGLATLVYCALQNSTFVEMLERGDHLYHHQDPSHAWSTFWQGTPKTFNERDDH
jgi:hypothetical protein